MECFLFCALGALAFDVLSLPSSSTGIHTASLSAGPVVQIAFSLGFSDMSRDSLSRGTESL